MAGEPLLVRQTELAVAGNTFEIEIIGERRLARLQPQPLLDPEGKRMRS